MTSVPKKIMNFRLLMKPDLLGRILIAMMESRDLVSVSRRVSRPIFASLVLTKVSRLETLNIAKKWFIKISKLQQFLFVVINLSSDCI